MNNKPEPTAVIKVGTNLVTRHDNCLNKVFIHDLARQINHLRVCYGRVILVSSGAIAAGRAALGTNNGNGNETDEQEYSALGMYRLMQAYDDAFAFYDLLAAQVLVTNLGFQHRETSQKISHTLERLMAETRRKIVPVVNENDSVSTDELTTDNDRIAGKIARLVRADGLVLLTDRPGVLEDINDPTSVIGSFAPGSDDWRRFVHDQPGTGRSRGGMSSKCEVASALSAEGIRTVIADGNDPVILGKIFGPEPENHGGTEFRARQMVASL